MKITLFLANKIIDFKLPEEISGSYSFDFNDEEESKLINIESSNEGWFLYETSDVKILTNNGYISKEKLVANNFYVLRRNNVNYLIYVSDFNIADIYTYTYDTGINIIISNSSDANIVYNCNYLNNSKVKINIQDGRLVLERSDNLPVYINKIALSTNPYFIKNGDVIEIYGLSFIFLNRFILINSVGNVKDNSNLKRFSFPLNDPPVNMEVKDVDLYDKNDYFSKSPRLRRIIDTKEIKLSAPPKENDNNQLPLILVIGPMLTMGIMAGTMLLNTVSRIYSKQTTVEQSWPQLVTSGAMLVSMIVWPLVTQWYNRRMKKKHKEELIKKYSAYLDEKRKELTEEAKLQKNILYENLITVNECLNIIKNKSINFWDKRVDQSDFLVVRLGIGKEKLDAKIEYPEEGFTIDESELRDNADKLVEEFKYIENVPVGYSLYENKTTAIMGERYKAVNFVHNVVLQLLTFYSYEDIKLVIFTNEVNKNDWEYLRYLKHTFTNEMDFRFLATDLESTKNVAEHLDMIANNRMNEASSRKEEPFKPHYIVIIDDYDMVKRYDLVKTITETDDNLGFSLLIIENRLSKLPSKCNNFITVGDNNSGVLKNSYEKQEQIAFSDEINYNIDMLQITKVLSNIPIEFEEGLKDLPNMITFLEMEKVGKVEQLNILNRWNTNDSTTSLKAEVGVSENGDLMYLDLHEKYHGPHGLIAGMTGSGKSEFIITYILSMCINYSPDDVSFILIDYKGGGLAGAFENKVTGVYLPHLAGTITNLDKAEMDRTLVSINSELQRRQTLFNQARDSLSESTIDIYKYQRFYKEGRLSEAIPHLFIICDEFAELKSQQPDFMDNLISVARIGRSLGVHLILATQKPSGVVNDQIWSNTKFRVCLKVQDAADSKEMLKRPEAASLKQTGRFYLQVGYDEYFALGQSAWCGAKYYPSEKIVKQVDKSINFINDYGVPIKSIQASSGARGEAKGEQISAILKSIIDIANTVNKKARRLWLPSIPNIILVDNLVKKYNVSVTPYDIEAVLGEYDAPEKQEQGLVKYNLLNDGNTLIYGNDSTEKEMLLNNIIYSTTKNHDASEINYYIIDYGSESMRRFISLPHVGGVVFQGEDEKYNNLLKLIGEELDLRKKLFVESGGSYLNYIKTNEKLPVIAVIINNFDSLSESNVNLYDEISDLVRDSANYGIIFIVTASTTGSVRNKLTTNFTNFYAFKLKEVSDYTILFGTRVKTMPRDIVGRGYLKNDGVHEFQAASIVEDTTLLNDYLMDFIAKEKEKNKVWAKKIPTLPEFVRYQDIENAISTLKSVPIGISKKDLEVVKVDLLALPGNIITANKINVVSNFIKSLLMVISSINNTNLIVIDATKTLNLDTNRYPNYYTDNFLEIIEKLINYLTKLIDEKSESEGVILIYGISKFISKLNNNNKFLELIKKVKEYEKMSIIIVDDVAKIKQSAFESWFTTGFNTNEGIFIGRGISDQNLLHLAVMNRNLYKDVRKNMAYYISEGYPTLLKVIDFISKDEEEEVV